MKYLKFAFVLLLASCSPLENLGVSPTPVIQPGLAEQAGAESVAGVTPSPAPFQFVLPQPGAEPISGWRPPLYSIPLAKTSNDHFYFARPIAADQVNWPIADYRYGGVFFAGVVHTGVDIDADLGAPIMAAAPGKVVWVGWGLLTETPGNVDDPYGIAVAIEHDFGYKDQRLYTVYAHMSAASATLNQRVETGDVIGYVGVTGATTGPHVHFEVRVGNNSFQNTYNPELWMAPPQGWGVLAGRVLDDKGKILPYAEVRVISQETKESFVAKTYGSGGAVNSDPYYNENVAIGDLPAGVYKINIEWDKKVKQTWVTIYPGQVSYFTFRGGEGFQTTPPSYPTLNFVPEALPFTPTLNP
ncbi:MAG: peptidoglycan DD-metalloendopeptidase family protein [Anaerolineales bacterium]|nr:peptidoglycan DD-metalloendopeptidase family protein [Anaerolineales bacterium]